MTLLSDKVHPKSFLMEEEADIKKILSNAKGQMTIFFATSVLVLITFIAFIVNIGIFVKAKINLQNAVDAAAYAGASVQARQLSNIAYLNWEMRNVYKEWMFKTYVLGNLSLPQVAGPSSDPVDFRMEPFSTGAGTVMDGYNVPSVCLDFSQSGNVSVCRKALVPGLPRFPSTEFIGMQETLDTFVDALGEEKADNCAQRSSINFLTNFIWAYNVPNVGENDTSDLAAEAPEVASDRPGAFPAAFNLALRIRNLEAQVNQAPYSGVCIGESPDCSQKINEIVTGNQFSPADERIYKAFQSGWRNLGGTDCDGEGADELKCSFTLSEIAPRVPDLGSAYTLSNLLIPSSKPNARNKHYLDLKLMPVNLATFYTMLAPVTTTNGIKVQGSGIEAEAAAECVATKVGLPVPGYPMGFVKNPEVLTYYAVKGESQFVGLFNPFASEAIKLTAYAAAKPFGGRIGPMIFKTASNSSYITPRTQPFKSSPYISAFVNTNPVDRFGVPSSTSTPEYKEGMPIPGNYQGMDGDFWLKNTNAAIGGWIEGAEIHYAIPNMPYDYPGGNPQSAAAYFAPDAVQNILPIPAGSSPDTGAGLYNSELFENLKSKLGSLQAGQQIDIPTIQKAIRLSRAPTLYDAYNYLIPTPETLNQELNVDSYGVIPKNAQRSDSSGITSYDMNLYAPIVSPSDPNALYQSSSDLATTLQEYTYRQEQAVLKYRTAMNVASKLVYDKNFSQATGNNYGYRAAYSLSGLGDENTYNEDDLQTFREAKPGCKSVNGKFVWFYTGNSNHVNFDSADCLPKNTLRALMESHWNNLSEVDQTYHVSELVLPEGSPKEELFSAYRPGSMNDASNGIHKNFLSGATVNMSRNFYSTKFTTLQSLTSEAGAETYNGNFAQISEGQRTKPSMIDASAQIKNSISQEDGIDLSEIRH